MAICTSPESIAGICSATPDEPQVDVEPVLLEEPRIDREPERRVRRLERPPAYYQFVSGFVGPRAARTPAARNLGSAASARNPR